MVSSQTNSTHPDFEKLVANLERLSVRIPEVPISGVLLSRLLLQLGRGMSSMLEHQIRPSGLAEAEFRVLTTLYSQPDGVAHPSDLCAQTSQSPANMSRISDALVNRQLITRVLSVTDRRKMVLRITEQGEELVQRLLPRMFLPLREIFGVFSDAEQRQLISQLKRLGAQLNDVISPELPERTP
jgi:MarR family transcriptional repressor of emrRAB